ncbi:hypothetical protein CBR_g31581 [Chara braunii]|uniref:Uncharacterized protein n=1 Tax=Chara braunii TaxID=69332 RepID=A0A388LFD5_CHABU|nr:hypothetical protein CBR_g31581 [Chara braunii]|eukprot:GBG81025.1 hypothetical protein CBR_g31581 [Chara braunii]
MANVANASSGESGVRLVPKLEWTVTADFCGFAKVSTYWIDVHPHEPWVLFSPTSKCLAVWDYEDGTLVDSWEIPAEALPPWGHSIFCAKFIAQKDWILIQCYGKAYVYETISAHLDTVKVLEHPHQYCLQGEMVVHPSLPYILGAFNETVVLWDWEKGWEMITFEGHAVGVRGVLAFHPADGNVFASASRSGLIKIWDISKRSCVQTLVCGDGVTLQLDFCSRRQKSLLLSCHKMLNSLQEQRTVLVWDYRKGVCLGKLMTPAFDFHSGRTAFFHPRLPYICSSSDDDSHIRVWDESTLQLVSVYDNTKISFDLQDIAPCKRSDDVIAFGREGEFFVLQVVTKGGKEESEADIQRETFFGKRPRPQTPADDINERALLASRKRVVKIEDEAVCEAEEAECEKRNQQAARGLTADQELRCVGVHDASRGQIPTKDTHEPAPLAARTTGVKIEDEAVCGVEPECEKRIQQVAADLKQRCMQVLRQLREHTSTDITDEPTVLISGRTDLKTEEDESVCADTAEPECESRRIQQVAASLMDDPELRCMGALDALRGRTPTNDIDEAALLALRKRVVKIEDEAVCASEPECEEEGIQQVASGLAAHLELRCMQALAALRGHTPTNRDSDEPSLLAWRKKALEFEEEEAVCAAAEPECEERIQQVAAGLAASLELKCMAALDALREEHRLKESQQVERIRELENELGKLKADVAALVERMEGQSQSARLRG